MCSGMEWLADRENGWVSFRQDEINLIRRFGAGVSSLYVSDWDSAAGRLVKGVLKKYERLSEENRGSLLSVAERWESTGRPRSIMAQHHQKRGTGALDWAGRGGRGGLEG